MVRRNSEASSLFEVDLEADRRQNSPLAHRLRPRTLAEYVGQEHILGPGRLLRRSIEADKISSLILYGPPGTGKTTLASVIAQTSRSHFVTINAVLAGIPILRQEIAAADERYKELRQRTTLFVDEVHRWNKAQQDALLPHVELGTVVFVGATTENPFFEVIKPLVSRSRVFQLQPLTEADIQLLLERALSDPDNGYGNMEVRLDPEAMTHLVDVANGDARSALNALELAVVTTPPNPNGEIHIDLATAEESIQRRAVLYDKEGDAHYDSISAFIKSLRGSDPDAALYWGSKMVYAGEDPAFLFRRMSILASEDVGLADPQAITVVESCWSVFERIGLPEGMYPLSQAIIYLATAPKSNSAMGIFEALRTVETEQESAVPTPLKDGNRDDQAFGHGKGYLYPHAFTGHWVRQQYLPAGLEGKVFYEPGQLGYEAEIRAEVLRRREEQLAADPEWESFGGENVTYSPPDRNRENWLQRAGHAANTSLGQVRDEIFARLHLNRHDRVLVLNADDGLLLWEACRRTPEGGVWGLVSPPRMEALLEVGRNLNELERPQLVTGLDQIRSGLDFEAFVGMDPCTGPADASRLWTELAGILPKGSVGICSQRLPRQGQRVYDLIKAEHLGDLRVQLKAVEEDIWWDNPNASQNWDEGGLHEVMTAAGFEVEIELQMRPELRYLDRKRVLAWFEPTHRLGTELRLRGVSDSDVARISRRYDQHLGNKTVAWQQCVAFCRLCRA